MPRTAVVVGAGPVGCLAALALRNAGWTVTVYDARPDMRLPENKSQLSQRSINLAISARGITALHSVNPKFAERFLDTAIPMRGRMIHPVHGREESQLYDLNGQCINSIDRALLNEDLLNQLTAASVPIVFRHKLLHADFDHKTLTFYSESDQKDVRVRYDFCIGADGCYSAVRRQLMRVVRMNYQQEYIPHEYIELRIPAGKGPSGEDTFRLDPNHLHIWPRHSFMLIALPNKDKTFTSTLFAPTAEFERFRDDKMFISWFRTHFPDALDLVGEDRLLHDYKHNPRSALIHIKTRPYHYKDNVILLGDAAHAMVPFYGQGLNCGLEDVRVLHVLLEKHRVDPENMVPDGQVDDNLSRALQEYTDSRHEDLDAICDLAMANYEEMRHAVTTPMYRLRKTLDGLLSRWTPFLPFQSFFPYLSSNTFKPTPNGWLALYTMVTFRPDIRYSEVRRKAKRQDYLLSMFAWSGIATTAGVGSLAVGLQLWARWRRC